MAGIKNNLYLALEYIVQLFKAKFSFLIFFSYCWLVITSVLLMRVKYIATEVYSNWQTEKATESRGNCRKFPAKIQREDSCWKFGLFYMYVDN